MLAARGRLDEAIAALHRAAEIEPDSADARYNLGNALMRTGGRDAALEAFRGVVERHPGHAPAHNNAAVCLLERDEPEPAVRHLRAAIEADPGFADAHANLAKALSTLGRLDEAERHCVRALSLVPDLATALVCHGNIHHARDTLDAAIDCYRRAADADPGYGAAFNNLGNVLAARGRHDEALTALRRAAEIEPDPADALSNLGEVLKAMGRLDEAIAAYDQALAAAPGHREARLRRALCRLLMGRFTDGWPDYLARDSMAARAEGFDRALLPADLSGRRCLVEREQGLGDEIFFLRYVPALRARGAYVAYRPDPRLADMLRRAGLADEIDEDETRAPGWDDRIAVADLAFVLGPDDESTPPSISLEPLASHAADIARRLAEFGPPPYLGLTWRAGTSRRVGRLFKNAPLDRLATALGVAPGTMIALQRAPEPGELDRLAAALGRPVHDLTALNDDLEAMLALVAALDDYVAVSNTNVHLRAAVGRASRVLVPNPPEFRWMAEGRESLWFPGTTVYRQETDQDWTLALADLARDLRAAAG